MNENNNVDNFIIKQNFNIVSNDSNFQTQNINNIDRLISQKFKIGNMFNNSNENNNKNQNKNIINENKNNNSKI